MKILRGPNKQELREVYDNMTPEDIFYKGFREDDIELVKVGIKRGFDIVALFTKMIYDYFFQDENGEFIFRFEKSPKIGEYFFLNFRDLIQKAWNNMDEDQRFDASVVWDNVEMFIELDDDNSFIIEYIEDKDFQHLILQTTLLNYVLGKGAFCIALYLIEDVKININEIDLKGNTALDVMLKGRNDHGFPTDIDDFDPYDPEDLKFELQHLGMTSFLRNIGARKSSELKKIRK